MPADRRGYRGSLIKNSASEALRNLQVSYEARRMSTRRCEIVVVGAGAMGLAATYHLAKQARAVTLVEQFGLQNIRGSSHGATRIARHSYSDRFYAQLMPAAFDA